ncbi:putative Ig domain-containing protein [Stenotrophomonas lactitubi]|uniref:putative Ig domain-containing protein n=1 Tax=Stenotrophomonas lactitubi TaxID=2045214 RepID=UPI001E153957|nr:putative Ig domain-containing protein [Stenotrophomonas lactitubi]CAH0124969.1 Esterase EstA [Stenotrophomonas lactitubi]CAH0125334.1 Esterase EstA [Stenotrophomonas lactitubi]CAH0138256.1 Esterase EstA [Stenotrophomonas lactitubi]CAH0221681.1 Esterase EstA [Stenotrophomonas lactitubi]
MHQSSAQRVETPRARSHAFFSSFCSWFVVALLCAGGLWPQLATAASSTFCPTLSMSVANSGSQTIDINHCHGGFGIAAGTAATPHGSRTVGLQSGANLPLTYTHNGDSASTDTFVIQDDFGGDINVTVTIAPASAITLAASPAVNLTVGVPFSTSLSASGGTGPYTYSLDSGSIPPGLSLSGNTISGIPTQRGAYAFTIRATDSASASGVRTFSGSAANPTLTIAPSTPSAPLGLAYSVTFTASGGVPGYTFAFENGSLPPGLSLSGAILSGTPTSQGSYTFGIRVADSSTGTGSYAEVKSVTLQVIPPPTIVVNPATVPGATVAVAYSQTFSASGGTAPYGFAITAGALPAGMSLNTSTGALTGTPTAAGTFNFTVTATDANSFTGSNAYTLVVAPPVIVIAPAALTGGTVGAAYSETFIASGGIASYSYAITAGALPAGVTLNGSNGVISGTPTAGGTFNFTVTATSSSTGTGVPHTGSRAYSTTFLPATVLLPATTLANGTQNAAYSATLNPASGGTSPYSYAVTAGALPAGITLNTATGALTGTPTASGTFNFAVTATDSSTGSGPYTSTPRGYTLQILNSPPVANPVSATVTYNSSANPITLNITGGVPTSVAIGTAAAHGSAVASGTTITYQPTAGYAGPDSFTYTATNTAGTSAPATVSITVSNPTITVTAGGPMNAQVGAGYSQTFTWNGGTAPYSGFTVTGLPAGLSVGGTTATSVTVSGTVSAAGSFSIVASATDSSTGNGPFTTGQGFTLTAGAPTLSMTPAAGNLPMNYGVATTINFASSGGTAPYSYALVAGSLPVGVTLTSAGVLSGTPTVPGNYNIAVRTTDSSTGAGAPFSLQQNYTIVVATPAIAIDPPSLTNGSAGVAYNAQLSSSGGVAPYSYALLSGALPIGISFTSAGALTGIPRSDGNFSMTVRSTDSNGQTGSRVYTFTITPATVVLTPATLPSGTVGTAYSQSLSSSGGIAPYTYAIASGALPPGISFSSAGVFSGTPTTAGSYTAVVRSTDDAGYNATQSYSIVIADAVPVAVDDSATTPSQQPVTIPVTANDGGVITSITVASAPAHGTATVSGVTVVYTPTGTFFGSDSFTYTATGPGGTSAPATVSITVNALPVPAGQPRAAVATVAGQPVTIDTTVGATGGPFTGVTLVTQPATGTTTVTGTNITYTPLATASGTASIVYTLNNAYGASAPITTTITINQVPVAVSRRVSANAGVAAVVELTTDATGGPFTAATLVSLSPASAGTATVAPSGSSASAGYRLTFTPAATFAGTATATFTLSNTFATSAPATIDFDVIGRPDPTLDAEVMGLLGAQTASTRRFATAQIGNFQRRMEGLHGAGRGERFENGLSFGVDRDRRCQDEVRRMPGGDCRQVTALDESVLRDDVAVAPVGGDRGKRSGDGDNGALTLWTGGSINSGDRDGRSGSAGFDFQTSGISAGADTRVNQAFAFGGGIGYGRDTTDVGHNDTRSHGESYTLAAYASYHPGQYFFVDGLLGYQLLSFDSRRYVTANGAMVQGDRDGKQWFASLSVGGDYQRDRLSVSPYARLDLARATLNGYTERGDAIYALRYEDQDVDTTTASLGVHMDYRFPVRFGTLSPQLRFEYQHDFQDASSVTMGYADLPGGPFYRGEIDGLKRNRFVFGLGAVLQTERDLSLRIEYRGLFGSSEDTDHGVQLNLEKKY